LVFKPAMSRVSGGQRNFLESHPPSRILLGKKNIVQRIGLSIWINELKHKCENVAV
jgi:hypothetical protein